MNKKRDDGWFTILPPSAPVNPSPGSENWPRYDVSKLEPITKLKPVEDSIPGAIGPVEESK